MNTERNRAKRNLVFLSVLFLLIWGINEPVYSQPEHRVRQAFDELSDSYQVNSISAEQYVAKVDSLVHQLFSEGKHFETEELVDLLSLYENIAWSKAEYGSIRISYFYLFFNNARMFRKNGASMYYAEKITEEYKKYGYENPLVEQLQKIKIYQDSRLYERVIEVFDSERPYLISLPERVREDRVDHSVALNAMYVLSPTLISYIRMNDTVSVYETALLAREIGASLQAQYPINRAQMLYNDLLMIDVDHSIAKFEHDYDSTKSLLDRMEALKTIYNDQATNFIDLNLFRLRIENYLQLEELDSVRAYIEKYESSPSFSDSQRATLAKFKSELQTLLGNHSGASELLSDALTLEREVQTALMEESTDLLYAYTQAEHNRIALQRSEKTKEQRTLWLGIISFTALVIVLFTYLAMQRRSLKAKEQITALNNAANMNIIAIEEARYQAIREEQQRLGQDLHDGLSSSIAAVRHRLEVLSMDIDDTALKNNLVDLKTEVAKVYDATRNKSYEWFSAAEAQEELSFEKRIKLLTDTSLPDSRYSKNIHVDDRSLIHVNADIRIALLRIIQEAVTNIIKHARAKTVDILIYEEENTLLLVVSDDGKGLEDKKPRNGESAMGLQSIRRRVDYLGGEIKIHSGSDGTEIAISIPFA